jgi:hypothetical protein
MRSNASYTATLILISLLSLAKTAAAQAGPTRSDPVDSDEEKIVVTVRAAADTPADKSDRATLTLIPLLSLAETAAGQRGPTRSDPIDNSEENIVVNVWAEADTSAEDQLSQGFAAAGLRATTLLREWQRRIAYNIRIGLPLCESCIAVDRDQAADALRLATLIASKDADHTALEELLNLFEDLQQWSDALVEDNRNMELGRYYMSPTALNDDPLFQKSAECARFLAPMLASGQLAEDSSCQ